jgi:hypothetical protein
MKKLILTLLILVAPISAHSADDNPYLNSYYAGICYVLDEIKKENKEQAEKIKAFRDIDFYLTKCNDYTSSFKKHYENYNNQLSKNK